MWLALIISWCFFVLPRGLVNCVSNRVPVGIQKSPFGLCMVLPRGLEPLIPPWEGDVLTTWPWEQIDLHTRLYNKIQNIARAFLLFCKFILFVAYLSNTFIMCFFFCRAYSYESRVPLFGWVQLILNFEYFLWGGK